MSSLSIASSTASVHTPLPIRPDTASSASTISSATSTSSSSTSTTTTTFTTSTSSSASTIMSTTTIADIPSATGVINPGNGKYQYYGCYNETTALNQTSGRRALYGGSMEASDQMSASECLRFCNIDNYAYAGLEYTNECWCADYLSVYSTKLADSQCNLACKGNSSELCGGRLTLTVYQKISSSSSGPALRLTNVPAKLFIAGLAIAGLFFETL